jgi:Cohesin domain
MQKKPLLSVLLLFLLILMLSEINDAQAQGTPVIVQITPASAQVGVGQTIDLAVEVVNVQGMYGFDVDLGFDPDAVEVVDADPILAGIQVSLGTFMDSGFVITNQVDVVAGNLRFAMTQLNPSIAKSGTGNLVVLRVIGKQANTISEIKLKNVQIAKIDGSEIFTSPNSGQIQVVQNIPGPTNTSVPTQGAGMSIPTESPTAPIRSTSTQRPVSSFPTATKKPTATSAGLTGPSATDRPPITGTIAVHNSATPTFTATSAAMLTETAPEQAQSLPTVLTLMSGIVPATPSPTASSTARLKIARLTATTLALNVIPQTQNSPTQTVNESFVLTFSALGLAGLFGLGGILIILAGVFILIKHQRS